MHSKYVHGPLFSRAKVMFIGEALDSDGVMEGRNIVGAEGRIFNKLLLGTNLVRSHCIIASCVKCRPVEWTENKNKQVPTLNYRGDHTTIEPSSGQVRECYERYLREELDAFQGHTIVGLGNVPLKLFTSPQNTISRYNGTIFECGQKKSCPKCLGTGNVEQKPIKCKTCHGRGKRGRGDKATQCLTCSGTGHTARAPKFCKHCSGSGEVPSDPSNSYVSSLLRPSQLFLPTYSLGYLKKQATQWPVVEKTFARISTVQKDLVAESSTSYVAYPEDDDFMDSPSLSLDLETARSMDPQDGDITCIGYTDRVGSGRVIAPHDGRIDRLLGVQRIIGQNWVLYDAWWIWHKYRSLPNSVWDTRFAGHLLNPDTPNDLVYLTGEYAQPPARGYWKTKQNYRNNIEEVCMIDVDMTMRVYEGQKEKLEQTGQMHIMKNDIIPLSKVLLDVRIGGMRVNRKRMERASQELDIQLAEGRTLLPDWGGKRTEGQHSQVQKYLYNTLSLPVITKRGTDKPTANFEALKELERRLTSGHKTIERLGSPEIDAALDFVQLLLRLRDWSKLNSSFMKQQLSASDYVHPQLNPAGTATLRFSCSAPNCQQIPANKDGSDFQVRSIFIPDQPGWEMLSVDLKQAEVIVLFWFAEQWDLLEHIISGVHDAHKLTASLLFGVKPENVTKIQRTQAKTTTFALLYGESPRTTATRNRMAYDDVLRMRRQYFDAFPGVESYRNTQIQHAKRYGFVESPFGVRRYVRVEEDTGPAANKACNAPIQNVPAMVTRRAMIQLHHDLPLPARILMQVHDELLLTYPSELKDQVHECVREAMCQAIPEMPAAPLKMAGGLRFPIDIETGPDWGSLK